MTKKILIINESPASMGMVKKELEDEDYVVSEVKTGKEGIEAASKEKPDVVMVDIALPDINGLEVCKKIRQNSGRNAPKIIVLTAVVDVVDAIAARRAGADDFCVKSIDMSNLVEAVKKLI